VLSAAVWVGGTVFLVAVAVPYARSLGEARRTEVAAAIGRRFRPVAWTAMAGLVLSGLYMLQKLGYLDAGLLSSPDGRLMFAKLILVALLIALSAFHDFVLGPRLERGEPTSSTFVVLARASGVLTLIVPVIGVLLAHS
jgi:putative copper export protein